MITYLQRTFVLTKQGAKDLMKGVFFSALLDLSFMLPASLALYLLHIIINLNNSSPNSLGFTIASLAILFVIGWVYNKQFSTLYLTTYRESANRRISLAEHLRQLPLSYFSKKDLSDLTNTIMGDSADLEEAFSHAIPQLIGSIISMFVISIPLFIINWKLAIALLWVVPIGFIILLVSQKLNQKLTHTTFIERRKVAQNIQEGFETIHEIKSNAGEDDYLRNFEEQLKRVEKSQINSQLGTAAAINTSQMILKLSLVTLVIVGLNLIFKGEIQLFEYLLFLIVASRIFDPIFSIFDYITHLSAIKSQINRMKSIHNHPVQKFDKECEFENYDIAFTKVRFSYNKNTPVLKEATFNAKQGEITALIGPSGSGKSTVLQLLARFWDIDKGSITIGGQNIDTIQPEELLNHFSIVFQDVTLFNNTIKENIRIGRMDATDEEIIEIASLAGCDDFINRLPEGINTVTGENGEMLSGGERQRISIARALLKDAPIVLLDEASASLDVENETKIQAAISKLVENKTVVVIAHRMRTISTAHQIVTLEQGKVVQTGSPNQLMQEEGYFSRMNDL